MGLRASVRKGTRLDPVSDAGTLPQRTGVANVLAAGRAGGDIVHTCVNGRGEFAGQPALDEVAAALEVHLGTTLGSRLEGLTEPGQFVADEAGLDLPFNRPVTGRAAFELPETEEIQEAFGRCAAMDALDAALTHPPALVGNRALMSMGCKCGRHTITFALARRGLTASDGVKDQIAAVVRATAAAASGCYLLPEKVFDALLASGAFEVTAVLGRSSAKLLEFCLFNRQFSTETDS